MEVLADAELDTHDAAHVSHEPGGFDPEVVRAERRRCGEHGEEHENQRAHISLPLGRAGLKARPYEDMAGWTGGLRCAFPSGPPANPYLLTYPPAYLSG